MTDQDQPFGFYKLPPFLAKLLKAAQSSPASWWGRRQALFLRKIVLKSYANNIIDAKVEGVRARFHLNDNVSERKFLFTPQFFDVSERNLIQNELPKDGVFVDVGANAGIYTLSACNHLGPNGKCLSIEPNPAVRVRLQNNISYNDFKVQPIIAPYGVSDVAGEFTLYLGGDNFGGASLIKDHANTDQSIQVKCYPLIDIVQDHGITHIDILKIDIEGAENTALRPFFDTADRALYPRYLIVENSREVRESGLIDFLTDHKGYNLLETTRMNFILKISS